MLWQLKNLVTNEALNEPGKLPQNWGPVFGLENFKDQLGDLSWLGEEYADKGWVQVEGELPVPKEPTQAEVQWSIAKGLLSESDWAVLPDVPMTNETKAQWITYRQALRDIRSAVGFPESHEWPVKPE